jgi:hypothetical protein
MPSSELNIDRRDGSVGIPAAISILRQALGLRATVEWPGDAGDETITVRWADATVPQSLRLRAIETAALSGTVGNTPSDTVPTVWILTKSTTAYREALRVNALSFVDLTGAVHLTLPWALIDRDDLTPARTARVRGAPVDPFADKSSLILRAMLERDRSQSWGVRQLAGIAGVALATASDVIRTLADRELVTVKRTGRSAQIRIADPLAVIQAWTHAYDWRMNRSLAVDAPVGDSERFLHRLPTFFASERRWALTLQAGASRRVPHATWDRVYVYVDVSLAQNRNALAALAARAGWEPAADGRLVLLAPHYRTTVWYGLRPLDDLWVVSDLQLILDLWNYPLRGREQAEVLLQSLRQDNDPRHQRNA